MTVLIWIGLLTVLVLAAQPQRVAAINGADAPAARAQTVPALAEENGQSLRRALLARLEFEELGLHLVGLAVFEHQPACFIKHPGSSEQMNYVVGDVIGGYRIETIEGDSVTFERDGIRMWLMLGETSDGRSAEMIADATLDASDELGAAGAAAAPLAGSAALPADAEAAATLAAAIREAGYDVSLDGDGATAGAPASLREVGHKSAENGVKVLTYRFKTAKVVEDGAVTRQSTAVASASSSDMFILPMSGRVTSGYGYRRHPIGGQSRFHKGLDIAAPYGTSVKAAAAGRVVKSSYSASYGQYVRIQHAGGYETMYAHLSKRSVETGDRVSQGETIGAEGTSGRSTGPHLHFEILRNGRPVNPQGFVKVR